ncbi:DUF294 nucleotidyltransferase-like domain-containing protein [Ammoniphilus sp. YIM 78166]|uniref:DUF294 nucleotidyltransferase-like domain-containing protein n=1 Tax=Ammoniphilus sp. YIM 78166 TaxID=1644106 RepID=UPI00106F956B|nr:DUF294 nucleotidyltransferase-like domain-containing protein [Ammoniphilus sp. YIM 78166]
MNINSHLNHRQILEVAVKATRETIFSSITTINKLHDQVHQEALEAIDLKLRSKQRLLEFSFSFLEMGSGGRQERTLWTDQDNAVIFSCGEEVRTMVHQYLVDWAEEAIQELSAYGYPLCDGWVMATNPRWMQSVTGWKEHWTQWTQRLTTENMRYLLLSLDLRPLYGDPSLLRTVRSWLHETSSSSPWIKEVMLYAFNYPLPIGLLGNLITPRYGPHADLFHLKEGGYYQMVTIIRVLALYSGIEQTSTRQRIEELYRRGYFSKDIKNKWLECLRFYLFSRLRHHVNCFQQDMLLQDYINLSTWGQDEVEELKQHLQFIRKQQKHWKKEVTAKKWEGLP